MQTHYKRIMITIKNRDSHFIVITNVVSDMAGLSYLTCIV